MPSSRARVAVASDVGTQMTSSPSVLTRSPRHFTRKAAVDPVPSPTLIPDATRVLARSATASLAASIGARAGAIRISMFKVCLIGTFIGECEWPASKIHSQDASGIGNWQECGVRWQMAFGKQGDQVQHGRTQPCRRQPATERARVLSANPRASRPVSAPWLPGRNPRQLLVVVVDQRITSATSRSRRSLA